MEVLRVGVRRLEQKLGMRVALTLIAAMPAGMRAQGMRGGAELKRELVMAAKGKNQRPGLLEGGAAAVG